MKTNIKFSEMPVDKPEPYTYADMLRQPGVYTCKENLNAKIVSLGGNTALYIDDHHVAGLIEFIWKSRRFALSDTEVNITFKN